MIFHAFHHQSTRRCTGSHVVEVGVDANHGRVVLDIVLAGGIGMLLLRCSHLVGHSCHTPRGGIVILVVRIDVDIMPADVDGSSVEDNLLVIGCHCIGDVLRHTRSQRRILAGEHRVIGILSLSGRNVFLSQLPEIIREGIAASRAEVTEVSQAAVRLQQRHSGVLRIRRVDCLAKSVLRRATRETVGCKVARTVSVRQRTRKVALHQGTDRITVRHLGDEIIGVHVAAEVIDIVRTFRVFFRCQIPRQDFRDHLFRFGSGQLTIGILQQVNKVACPAAIVQCCGSLAVIVCQIHGSKHMRKFHQSAVWGNKSGDAANCLRSGTIIRILLRDIAAESGILSTGQHCPAIRGVLLSTGTNEVQHQSHCVFIAVEQHVVGGIAFQHLQAGHKGVIVGSGSVKLPLCVESDVRLQTDDRALVGIACASTIFFRVPTDKLVVLTREGVCGQICAHALHEGLRIHAALAAVSVEGNGVPDNRRFVVGGRICHVASYGGGLVSVGIDPAAEAVIVVVIARLGRGRTVIARRSTVGNVLVRLQNRAVRVLPFDSVGSKRALINSRVAHIGGDGGIVRYLGRPVLEFIGVLGILGLSGRGTVIARLGAPCHALILFQNGGTVEI